MGYKDASAYGAGLGAHRLDCGGKRSATPLSDLVQGAQSKAAWRYRFPPQSKGRARRANAARVERQPFSLSMNRSAEYQFGANRVHSASRAELEFGAPRSRSGGAKRESGCGAFSPRPLPPAWLKPLRRGEGPLGEGDTNAASGGSQVTGSP